MTEKLKNCPFCGGNAIASHAPPFASVHCEQCDAEIIRIEGRLEPNRYEEAVSDWNKRAMESAAEPIAEAESQKENGNG